MAEIISTVADISTIWLAFLTCILSLVPLAIIGAMVYGMRKLLIALPPIFKQGQEGMARVAREADRISKKIAAPFVAASASASQAKGMFRSFSKVLGGKDDLEE